MLSLATSPMHSNLPGALYVISSNDANLIDYLCFYSLVVQFNRSLTLISHLTNSSLAPFATLLHGRPPTQLQHNSSSAILVLHPHFGPQPHALPLNSIFVDVFASSFSNSPSFSSFEFPARFNSMGSEDELFLNGHIQP